MHNVRPAVDNDEDALYRLAVQLSTRFIVERTAFATIYPQLLRAEDVYLHVVEASGIVVAYLLGWTHLAFYSNGPAGWVQELVVHPEHRRKGVGKLLMEHFEGWTAARGGRLVSLATRGAPEFYLALGYRESATYFKKSVQPENRKK